MLEIGERYEAWLPEEVLRKKPPNEFRKFRRLPVIQRPAEMEWHMVDVAKVMKSNINELQPIWLVTVGCLSVVSLCTWLLARWFYTILGDTSPFVLTLVAGGILFVVYGRRAKEKRAAIKSVFDISWNIWTLIGAAFLFHAAASVENPFDVIKVGNDLSATLKGIDPAWLSFIFLWVYQTAAGRVVFPFCDAVWTPPIEKPTCAVAKDPTTEKSA